MVKSDCDLTMSDVWYVSNGIPTSRGAGIWYGHGAHVQPSLKMSVFGSAAGSPHTRSTPPSVRTLYAVSVVSVFSVP